MSAVESLPSAFDLSGTTALVTGAGSVGEGVGNGRAAAVLLAEAGARVACLDLEAGPAEETLQMIRERGGDGHVVTADVSAPEQVEAAVAASVDALGPIDILVNNVGIVGPRGTAVEVDPEAWDATMRINVTSMMLCAKHCIPHMRERGGGAIVNVTSLAALGGGYPALLYPTSKAALVGLTQSMAAHHGPEGIRVNAIAPGQAYTPRIALRQASPEMRRARVDVAPLPVEGTGWDVGMSILFLCSPAARWITGVVLAVDGGLSATLPLESPPSRD